MNLTELLVSKAELIMEQWLTLVSGQLHPEAMPHPQLIDHLPLFLEEIAQALKDGDTNAVSSTAALHGDQRLDLGFSLDAVVREYGALQQAVLTCARNEGVAVSERERDLFDTSVINGIARAVSEYQRQRDAELQRHMNEHFAFIAHELRNPLGSALAAFGMIERRDGLVLSERFARVLSRSLLRMQELIDTTLRAAQLSTGITLQREPMALAALLEDMDLAVAASADERSIELVFHVEGDRELSVDRRLVQSALSNLIRNAVKFSHDGGRVEVRARADNERVLIEVEDCCGGLPEGAVLRAFAPFTQLGSDRSGFGLGLAIAKQAADAHDGSINVQNLPGKGCIFALDLPIQPAK